MNKARCRAISNLKIEYCATIDIKYILDTLRNIDRIWNLKMDPFDTINLVNAETEAIVQVKENNHKELKSMPYRDASLDYRKLGNSLWDISPEKLFEMTFKSNKRDNQEFLLKTTQDRIDGRPMNPILWIFYNHSSLYAYYVPIVVHEKCTT